MTVLVFCVLCLENNRLENVKYSWYDTEILMLKYTVIYGNCFQLLQNALVPVYPYNDLYTFHCYGALEQEYYLYLGLTISFGSAT